MHFIAVVPKLQDIFTGLFIQTTTTLQTTAALNSAGSQHPPL
jgi:hypothetical protein